MSRDKYGNYVNKEGVTMFTARLCWTWKRNSWLPTDTKQGGIL